MRSSDTQFMLAYIKCYITEIRNTVLQVMQNQHAETMDLERKVEEEISKIEQQEELILEDEDMLLAREMQQKSHGGDMPEIHPVEEISQPSKEEKLQEVAGLQIPPGEKSIQSTSMCGSPVAPIINTLHRLHDTPSDASRGMRSKVTNDETQANVKKVCDDIGAMRIELKEILLDISSKLGYPLLPFRPMRQDRINAEARPDLLVVPDVKPSCMLTCCTNPPSTEKQALGILPEPL